MGLTSWAFIVKGFGIPKPYAGLGFPKLFWCIGYSEAKDKIGKICGVRRETSVVINGPAIEEKVCLELYPFREVIPETGLHAFSSRFLAAIHYAGHYESIGAKIAISYGTSESFIPPRAAIIYQFDVICFVLPTTIAVGVKAYKF